MESSCMWNTHRAPTSTLTTHGSLPVLLSTLGEAPFSVLCVFGGQPGSAQRSLLQGSGVHIPHEAS